MNAMSLKLPDPIFADLTRRAQQLHASHSEVVRAALTAYFANEAAPVASAASKAQRWTGLGEGAVDLATNPTHLEGFGK